MCDVLTSLFSNWLNGWLCIRWPVKCATPIEKALEITYWDNTSGPVWPPPNPLSLPQDPMCLQSVLLTLTPSVVRVAVMSTSLTGPPSPSVGLRRSVPQVRRCLGLGLGAVWSLSGGVNSLLLKLCFLVSFNWCLSDILYKAFWRC